MTFNNYGITYQDIVHMFPGQTVADFDSVPNAGDGDQRIEEVIVTVAAEVNEAINSKFISILQNPKFETLESYARGGEVTFTLGLSPVVSGSVDLYLVSLTGVGGSEDRFCASSTECGCPIDTSEAAMDANYLLSRSEWSLSHSISGSSTVTLSTPLVEADALYASYQVDTDSSFYSSDSLAGYVKYGVAAEMGFRNFSTQDDVWGLVTFYKDKYEKGIEVISKKTWQPAELNGLEWLNPIVIKPGTLSSFRIQRG